MLMAYNQVPIPSFMYGTAWKKDATTALVQQAVAAGFTAIDTANQLIHYQEALVGEALLELTKQGTPRERLLIQTKFTPVNGQDHRTPYDAQADLTTQVKQSFDSSLAHLHTDYLDSYVLHGHQQRVSGSTATALRTGRAQTHGRPESLLRGAGLGSGRAGDLPGARDHLSGVLVAHGQSGHLCRS